MHTYDEILSMAAERKGSFGAVLDGIPEPKSAQELAQIPGDRWLSTMARGIMQAGISWKVVENKWPGIEDAFHGFDIGRCAMMSEDWFDALIQDPRIVRSPPKVRAIQHNAALIQEISESHGSFGRLVADWPQDDFAGLLIWLQKNGSRLGGSTGAYMLRVLGKDGFILSKDVVARLIAEGVIDKAPASKKGWMAVQDAFNTWAAQSGQSLTVISRVLAQSIDS